MANYLCDVLRIHKASRMSVVSALRARQWGFDEGSYNRIIVKKTDGSVCDFWPRVSNNIALRGQWLTNSGITGNGIRVSDEGMVGIGSEPFSALTALTIKSANQGATIRLVGKNGNGYGIIGIDDSIAGRTRIDFRHESNVLLSLAMCGIKKEIKIWDYIDINSVAWSSFSTGNVVGLIAAGLDKRIRYKKVGNLIFVSFYLSGTTEDPGFVIGFDLPFTGKEDVAGYFPCNLSNDGSMESGAIRLAYINAQTKVFVGRGLDGSGAFSTSVAATVSGQFFYEAE